MDNRHVQFRKGLAVPGLQVTTAELQKLQRLFQVSAFWAGERRLEDWAVAIAHSSPIISVWDHEELIGFARATSDGIYRAMVWDVVVHPDYRGQGLGRQLVQTLLAHPHMNRVERVYLTTTHQQSFYEHIGFVSNSSTTMVLHQQGDTLPAALDSAQPEIISEQLSEQ